MTNVVPIRAFGGAARRELIARTIIMNCACERFFAQPASSDSSTRPSQQMPLDPLVPLKNAKFRTNTNRGACHSKVLVDAVSRRTNLERNEADGFVAISSLWITKLHDRATLAGPFDGFRRRHRCGRQNLRDQHSGTVGPEVTRTTRALFYLEAEELHEIENERRAV